MEWAFRYGRSPCAQSADWCGAEPGGDRTRCAVQAISCGVRCVPVHRPHRRPGWRVDGGPAFLMAFTDEATVYQVRTRHRNEERDSYGGVARGRSYDAQALSGVKRRNVWPTCCARSVRWSRPRERGRSFGNRLSRLLREAMELRQAYHRGEAADFAAEARLRREATYHLRDRPMPDNWRLQNELGWHHDRKVLIQAKPIGAERACVMEERRTSV